MEYEHPKTLLFEEEDRLKVKLPRKTAEVTAERNQIYSSLAAALFRGKDSFDMGGSSNVAIANSYTKLHVPAKKGRQSAVDNILRELQNTIAKAKAETVKTSPMDK